MISNNATVSSNVNISSMIIINRSDNNIQAITGAAIIISLFVAATSISAAAKTTMSVATSNLLVLTSSLKVVATTHYYQ